MLNKVQIIGRIGSNPELKYTQTGNAFCSLNVATDESYINSQGEKIQQTEWHRVQVWNKQAENCATYLAKRALVYVEGSISTRKWQAQDGTDRYTTEIKAQRVQFLDRKNSNSNKSQDEYYQQTTKSTNDSFITEASEMDNFPF